MTGIQVEELTKTFTGGVVAVDHVSIAVEDGEFLVLVGPSGCGKSTLLRMIAGLEEATEGRVLIGEQDVTRLPPQSRDIAMVFQNYALYPHMSVQDNLAFALKIRRMPRDAVNGRVTDVARLIGLADLLNRRPSALSGGQRQRVAMGRAIVRQPSAFLMDEPLSNLDAKLRVNMRAELSRLHERLRTTTVYVTHDQTEAMTLGHRVAVMRAGRVQQIANPQALYRSPANLFVAAFIGSPAMNLVRADIDGESVSFGGWRLPLDRWRRPASDVSKVILGIRPEAFEDVRFADRSLPKLEVEVSVLEELGADAHVIFPVAASPVDVAELRDANEGEDTTMLETEGSIFNARLDPRTTAQRGSMTTLAVDPAQFFFFDAATGANLLDGLAASALIPG